MADAKLIERLRGEIASLEANAPSKRDYKDPHALSGKAVRSTTADSPYEDGFSEPCKWGGGDGEPKRGHAASQGALSKIVSLVNISDRSEHAIRERLAREGFDRGEIDESVERAKEYGYIDDTRYAEVLVRSRISQGKGSEGIVRELQLQGIDIGVVAGWPYDYPVSFEDEVNRALDLLERKPPQSKHPRESAYRKLMGRGFPSSVASTSARIWAEKDRG